MTAIIKWKKYVSIFIICLFVGVSITPSISAYLEENIIMTYQKIDDERHLAASDSSLAQGQVEFYSRETHWAYKPILYVTYSDGGVQHPETYDPLKDTFFDPDMPDSSYGSTQRLNVSYNNDARKKVSCIYFDISDIPSTATIISASLSLRVHDVINSMTVTVVELYQTASTWFEINCYNDVTLKYWAYPADSLAITSSEIGSLVYWDVTNHIENMIYDPLAHPNRGFALTYESPGSNQNPSCTISANPNSGTPPLTVTFSMIANDPDGTINYWWLDINNNGNNEYSGSGYPHFTLQHTYNTLPHTAKLTVIDDKGAYASSTATISESDNDNPVCSFYANPLKGNPPLEVTYHMSATDYDGFIDSWFLDIDNDGNPERSGNNNPPSQIEYTFNGGGEYLSTFQVTDNEGGTCSSNVQITVNHRPDSPTVEFVEKSYSGKKSNQGQVNELLYFDVSSKDDDGDDLYYYIDWDDGGVNDWDGPYKSNEKVQYSHSWESSGIHTIAVTIKDDPNKDGDLSDGVECESIRIFDVDIVQPTKKILVVPTYFSDQNSNIWSGELDAIRERVDMISDYYQFETFSDINIQFDFTHEPIGLPLSHGWYIIGGFPIHEYPFSIWEKIDRSPYDAILGIYMNTWDIFGLFTGKNWFGTACVEYNSHNWGIWAHEIGHTFITIWDYYNSAPIKRGNIGPWGLMGRGPDCTPPAPIFCLNKKENNWLETEVHSDFDEPVVIDYLKDYSKMDNNIDKIPQIFVLLMRHDYDAVNFYLEARSGRPFIWNDDYPGIVIYKYVPGWGVGYIWNIENGRRNYPTLCNLTPDHEDYFDVETGLLFSYEPRFDEGVFKPIVTIKKDVDQKADKNGVIATRLGSDDGTNNFQTPYYTDIDIHAYTTDGKHVGMNYDTDQFENQISGCVFSGDQQTEEFILVPKNIEVRFSIVGRGDYDNVFNFTTRIIESGSNPDIIFYDGYTQFIDWNISTHVFRQISVGQEYYDLDNDGIPFYQEVLDGTNPNNGPIFSLLLNVSINPCSNHYNTKSIDLEITVKAGEVNLSRAEIELSSNAQCTFTPVIEERNGLYKTTMTIEHSSSSEINITASASKLGCINGSDWVVIKLFQPPIVSIHNPSNNDEINKTVIIKWNAYDSLDGENLPIYLYLSDDNGDNFYPLFDNPVENNGEISWDTTTLPDGEYKLLIEAQDQEDNVGHDDVIFTIKNHEDPIENLPPLKPAKPTGTTSGKPDETYTYSSMTNDPDGDQIWFNWDFGDDGSSGWVGPYDSGEACEVEYSWDEEGDYSIKVKAKDVYGEESPWSDPLTVSMPRAKLFNQMPRILLWLFERFPFFQSYFNFLI
ncbi:PKD domain-containing protein [Thermoplasmatota archaeon]